VDRGIALVSMAVAITLGATSMNDIVLLAHQEPVLGAAPSDTTVPRRLELADRRTPDKIARVRAGGPRVRLVADRGDPRWVSVAGHRREAAGGRAGHRLGRHLDHGALGETRRRSHV
jgi:hypothetical protein